jgi:uncharacterized membrane protein
MISDVRAPIVRVEAIPVHRFLQAFPVAGFAGALVTDVMYVTTTNMIWADFSDWLLAVGFGVGILALIAGLINLVRRRRVRSGRLTAVYVIGSLVVMILAGFNNFVHSRDAWTSVMPEGLALSVATVVVMLLTYWLGSRQAYRESIVVNQIGAGI